MSLKDHAHQEMLAVGMMNKDADYNGMLPKAVMELIETFAAQGHSGSSAHMVIELFTKLAQYEPLSPLTGHESEWTNVSDMSDDPIWQNKRCSHVFKDKEGRAYDLNGIKRIDADGYGYFAGGERCYITFPYTPVTTVYLAGDPLPTTQGVPA